jgi:hypothetical protein
MTSWMSSGCSPHGEHASALVVIGIEPMPISLMKKVGMCAVWVTVTVFAVSQGIGVVVSRQLVVTFAFTSAAGTAAIVLMPPGAEVSRVAAATAADGSGG